MCAAFGFFLANLSVCVFYTHTTCPKLLDLYALIAPPQLWPLIQITLIYSISIKLGSR